MQGLKKIKFYLVAAKIISLSFLIRGDFTLKACNQPINGIINIVSLKYI